MDQAVVTFEDVAVYFTRREWETLSEEQKTLYKEVMNDNYQMILSLNRPDIIMNIQLGCEPYVRSHAEGHAAGSWQEKKTEDGSSVQKCDGDITSSRCEVKRQRRYPRVNPFRWIKKDKKRKSRLSRSTHHISRRCEEKKADGEDYQVETSPERSISDPSACISQDSASNLQDESLPAESFTKGLEREDLRFEEGSDHEAAAEPSHHLEEASGSRENLEDVSERSGLTKFTEDAKKCEKPAESSHPNVDCHHRKDDVDSRLDGDSKDVPVSETSDLQIEANNESPSKMGTPKKEKRSPSAKKKASHHKKDKHVKFSEVVTMILIEQHSEQRCGERRLPICNNLSEEDKKKEAKCSSGRDLEEDGTSQGRRRNVEGTRQPRKRKTVLSCEAEEEKSCCPGATKKKRIVEGMGAPELEALSPTKEAIQPRHDLHHMNECSNMKSEDRKEDRCSRPSPPNAPPNEKLMKSYSCSICGKITQWSKLSLHQKENIERSMAHMCRRCGRHRNKSSDAAPPQTVRPLSLTSGPASGQTSRPVHHNKKIPASSSAQPSIEKLLPSEKKTGGMRNETLAEPGSLITANDLRTGAKSKKSPQTSQDDKESNLCCKCRNPGAAHGPKLKTITGSSSNKPSAAGNSVPDPGKSRIGTKDKKVTSKVSVEEPEDIKEHKVCAKCGKSYIKKRRNHPPRSDQQKKPTKTPSTLHKTQDHLTAALKTGSASTNGIKNPKPDKDCTKCGKSLAKHVHPENPGGEKNCVLRLKKKKSKRPLDGTEPFQCKECGKVFTRHFTLLQHRTVHTGERPYSCKECGKSFRDGGYLKIHMRLHTKEKPYTCPECGKCFGQNPALVAHLRTHTDERPFHCNECGKRFSDRSTFRHHQMIHTGEKPFTCSFCGKKFTQQAHVKRHEKMHTGERPFGCSMCDKRFIDRTKLRKHELTHDRKKV